jgi:hypothetical protein
MADPTERHVWMAYRLGMTEARQHMAANTALDRFGSPDEHIAYQLGYAAGTPVIIDHDNAEDQQ